MGPEMAKDLRCEFIKHAELVGPGFIEFKCRSKYCGSGNGVVVIHRFSTVTGELIATSKFKDPKGVINGSAINQHSVRNAAGEADDLHRRNGNGILG